MQRSARTDIEIDRVLKPILMIITEGLHYQKINFFHYHERAAYVICVQYLYLNIIHRSSWAGLVRELKQRESMGPLEKWPGRSCMISMMTAYCIFYFIPAARIARSSQSQLNSSCQGGLFGLSGKAEWPLRYSTKHAWGHSPTAKLGRTPCWASPLTFGLTGLHS